MIPFVFAPWPADGRLLTDGFLSDPLSVDVAIRENAHVIVALGFDSAARRCVDSPARFAFQVTTVMANNLLRSNFAFHNLAHRGEVIPTLPESPEHVRAFDTTKLHEIVERGEEAMEREIPYLRALFEAAAR